MRYLLRVPLGGRKGGLFEFTKGMDEPSEGFNPKLMCGPEVREFFRRCLAFGEPVSPQACFGARGFFELLIGGRDLSDKALGEKFEEMISWNKLFVNGTNEPGLMPFVERPNIAALESLKYKPIDEVLNEPKKKTLELELFYDDFEETPAGNTPYKITFSNNEVIKGTLDDKGAATIPNTPDLPARVEFGDKAAYDEAVKVLGSAYQRLSFAIDDAAKSLGAHMLKIARSKPKAEVKPGVHADFKKAVEKELADLKARSDVYNSSSTLQKFIAQGKAVGSGVVSGFSDYVPDLGEFGDLMDEIDIDVTDLVDAIATGDVSELEKKLRAWKKRSEKGLEQASHTMEMLVLLLSDKNSRELIANLPVRLLEVMPPDEVTEILTSQATQTGIDYALITGGTAAGTAAGGVGGPIAAATLLAAAATRKGGKLLENIIKILTEIAKKLKDIAAYQLGGIRNYKKKNKLPQTSEARKHEEELNEKLASQPESKKVVSGGDQEPEKDDGKDKKQAVPSKIAFSELGDHLGSGGNKDVYAFGKDNAVGVLKKGKNPELITDEISLLNQLDELGLPTVNAKGPIDVDDRSGLIFDKFEKGSKDIVRLERGKVRIVGESPLLNQRSIDDLKSIRKALVDKKVKVNDLQFLIGKDGRIVIADPLDVSVGSSPSKNNLRMIDLLIQSAQGK